MNPGLRTGVSPIPQRLQEYIMNKLILALSAALLAASAMAADAPKTSPATGVEQSAPVPKTATKAHHHTATHHHKAGKKAHHKSAS
jgi:opacity protein-like surface antigen